ncbi:MAG: NAD(P)H-dependent oxidoreductase subunit E [Desulfobacterota bacterium]|nr:NAD(P)H-dependent oxidoreductase subunit E [Thermodesulfobacteriota bacterium]MDW8001649.1 NAD(P)H-dependent oxidoreductase subunit E [Deltaproteobacteria bacterium]
MEWLDRIIAKYNGKRNYLVEMLIDIQHEKGYIPRESVFYLGEKLSLPPGEIFRMASFYKAFSLIPRADHTVKVCMGSSCCFRGGKKILEELKNLLGIEEGETTLDMKFKLETSSCSGRCALGPEIEVDGEVYVGIKAEDLKNVIEKIL